MSGMGSGLQTGNSTMVAAFRAALLHQGILIAVIFALLVVAWISVREWLPATSAGDAGGGRSAVPALAEPAARRMLRIGFGVLWIQIGIGIWLLVAARGTWSRLGGLASVGWGLIVWVFGEAFGGVFGHGLTWLFGAPGAVLLSCVAGGMIALPVRAWATPRLGRLTLAGIGLFLVDMAVLHAWPGRGFWQGTLHGQPGSLTSMIKDMAQTSQPHFLSALVSSFASFVAAHGFAVNLFAVIMLAAGAEVRSRSRDRELEVVVRGRARERGRACAEVVVTSQRRTAAGPRSGAAARQKAGPRRGAAALICAAGILTAGCGAVQAGHPAVTPTVAPPSLTTSLVTTAGTWAVVPMGGSPAFWQLVRYPAVGSRATGWSLVTPPGVADNGGLVLADLGGQSLVAGFRPSEDLVYSPLATTADAGRTWSPGILDASLADVPDALAAGADGHLLALLKDGTAEQSVSATGTSGWSKLDERARAGRITGGPEVRSQCAHRGRVQRVGGPLARRELRTARHGRDLRPRGGHMAGRGTGAATVARRPDSHHCPAGHNRRPHGRAPRGGRGPGRQAGRRVEH